MILIPYGYSDYTVGKVAHQMQDFQLDSHQKTFGGRALRGTLRELERSHRPPSPTGGLLLRGRVREEGEG